MTIDRKVFFDAIRDSLFDGSLMSDTVMGVGAILNEWEDQALPDRRWLAYMLGTVRRECGPSMVPVREGFAHSDAQARAMVARLGRRYDKVINGHVYYGRGLVQLTWDYNYKKMATITRIDLYDNPDLALVPVNAALIMFEGMTMGSFTGKKLSDFISGETCDYYNARTIINGHDAAEEIETHAKKFDAALTAASQPATTTS